MKELQKSNFKLLPRLTQLMVGNPSLIFLHPGAFTGLNKLEKLALTSTSLETISSLTLTDLLSLKHLDLSNNMFQTLEEGSLPPLPSLITLHISHCPFLSILQTPSFPLLQNISVTHNPHLKKWESSTLPALLNLNLRQNNLATLPGRNYFPNISSIYLEGNPLQCECPLYLWQLLLQSMDPLSRDNPQCSSYIPLMTTNFPSCSSSHQSPFLAVGLAVGLLFIFTSFCILLLYHRLPILSLVSRLKGCTSREVGVTYHSSRIPQEDYWLSLVRRSEDNTDPARPVPVTEL